MAIGEARVHVRSTELHSALLGVCPGQPPVPRLRQDAALWGEEREERDRNIFTGTLDAVQFKVSLVAHPARVTQNIFKEDCFAGVT